MNQQYGQGGGYGGQQSAFTQGGGFSSQQGGSPYQGGGNFGGQGGPQGFQGGMQGGYGGQGGGYGAQQQQRDVAVNPYTMDKDYDLISVLYHSLQAAETCGRYRQDALQQGNPEIAQFMDQVQQQNQQIAQRAKELLFRQRQV